MKRLLPASLLMSYLLLATLCMGQNSLQRPLLRQEINSLPRHASAYRGSQSHMIPSRHLDLHAIGHTSSRSSGPKSELIGMHTPEVGKSFEGNNFNVQAPPSNTIAISNEGWIVAIINSSISYYFEDGSVALDSEDLSTFYDYLDLSETIFNPQIVFDPVGERFIFAALHGKDASSSRLIISFSFSQDPADGWWSYNFDNIAEASDKWMSEMRIGLSAEDLYITGNLHEENSENFSSIILQIDKETGYEGQNLGYNYWSDVLDENNEAVGTLIPLSDGLQDGYGPGINLLGARKEGGSTLQFFEINADSDGAPFLSGFYYEIEAYSPGEAGQQAASDQVLDIGGSQIQSAFIKDGVIHLAHHNRIGDGSNGIRYMQLDLLNETYTYIDLGWEGQTLAYPAITPLQLNTDENSTTLLHFSHSSPDTYPSIYMLTLDQDLVPSYPVLVKAGEGPIESPESPVPWGHYSGIARRHNAAVPTAWIFGSYGKNETYGNWIAEVGALGGGLNWPCQNAEQVFCGSTIGGSTEVNAQLLPACIGAATSLGGQWYRLLGHGGDVLLSTCNDKTDFDTRILIFKGNCTNLVCLEAAELSNCDQNTSNPDLGFYAVDGDEYFIYVTASGDSGGNFEMTLSCEAQEGTCTGDQVLTDCEGVFVDGSGDNPYSNDLACSWTISPYAAATITLNFANFSTEEGFDYVSIYDGSRSTDTLIAQFSGNSIPEQVTAKSGYMHVLFESDGSFTDAGWLANYSCTLQQTPEVDFTADTLQGLVPFTVNFTNLTQNLPADFLWDFGDGITSSLLNPSHTYTTPGTYTVSLTATNLAGEDSKVLTNYIIVEPDVVIPETNFTQDQTCGTFPMSVNFEDRSSHEPTSWQWDFGNGETSSLQNPSTTYTTAGIYTVKLVTSNEAGEDELVQTHLITVVSPISITAPDGVSGCLGSALPLKASGAESFSWIGPGLASTIDSNVLAAPTVAGDYIYIATGTTNGCASEPDSIMLSFVTAPLVSISASSTITCLGEAVKLIGSGADTYQWEGVGLTANTGSQVVANPVLPGSYTYELVGTEAGCNSPTQAITVLFNSVPEVELSPTEAQLCEGDSIRLVASGGGIYSWTGPGLESFEQSETWVKPDIGMTEYSVSSTVNGCQSSIQTSSITVSPTPVVSFEAAPSTLCLGDTLLLIGRGASSYQWNGPNILQQFADSIFAQPLDEGTFTYQLIGLTNACPSAPLEHTVEVLNKDLSVSIEAANCPGPALQFQATVMNGGMTSDDIIWYLNDEQVATGATYTAPGINNGDQVFCTATPIDPLACTSPATATSNVITIDCLTVDTKEPQAWSGVELFPNPNSGRFQLGMTHRLRQALQISIYNTLGQLIHQQSFETIPGRQSLPIDIQGQVDGLYWLVISSATETQTLSFLKQ